jgi:hypothetical protein
MTGKEVVKGVALNTPLGRTIKNLLETYDANHMKTVLKVKQLGEAMDEDEISFHKQTVQNRIIETDLEGIESAKRNYNDTRLRQNVLMEIKMKKPALMVYTVYQQLLPVQNGFPFLKRKRIDIFIKQKISPITKIKRKM